MTKQQQLQDLQEFLIFEEYLALGYPIKLESETGVVELTMDEDFIVRAHIGNTTIAWNDNNTPSMIINYIIPQLKTQPASTPNFKSYWEEIKLRRSMDVAVRK